jgi:hypothetical protein
VSPETLKLSAEIVADVAITERSPASARAALEILDTLKAQGLGSAAELLRGDLESIAS